MKKITLAFVGIFCTVVLGYSQKLPDELNPLKYPNGTAILHESELIVKTADISKYDVLDTAHFVVTYHFAHPYAVKGANANNIEQMNLEVGRSYTAFYSQDLLKDDSVYTYVMPRPISANRIRFSVYENIKDPSFEVVQRIPFNSGVAILVKDTQLPQWRIDTLKSEIMGYECFRAETNFKGRTWTVWYTPEIPLSVGPWKLCGLPGMVFNAEDSEHLFSFECVAIAQKATPIKRYQWQYTPMTQPEWLKYEKRMHDAPFEMFSQQTLIIGIGDKHKGRMDNTWTVPYNPIERE